MTDTENKVSRAEQENRLQMAVSRLLMSRNWSFWGAVACMLPQVVEDHPIIKTAGLMYTRGSSVPHVYYNPNFLSTLTQKQIAFLIVHENKHYVYMHPWQRKGRNNGIFNIAADRYINTGTTQDAFTDRNFYIRAIPECYVLEKGSSISNATVLKLYDEELKKQTDENGNLTEEAKQKMQAQAEAMERGEPTGHIDNHDLWEDIINNQSEEEAKVEVERISEEAAKMAGTMPHDIEELIRGFHKPRVPWKRHLRSWVGRTASRLKDLSWGRVHRVLPDDLPGTKYIQQSSVGVVVDVSGSISDEDFRAFISEIAGINKRMPVRLLQLDVKTKGGIEDFNKRTIQNGIKRLGRGGTDMNPGIKEFMEHTKTDMVIVLTDGFIPLINTKVICKPLLFVITQRGKKIPPNKKYRQIQIPPS